MKLIEGRKDDFIVLSDDGVISPRILSIHMQNVPGIYQYKIIQETREKIVVQLVPSNTFSQETIKQTEKEIRDVLGEHIIVEIDVKEEIPKEPSSKLRKVVSKVNKINW